MAVVGLGYWGPNLIRNLHELPLVKTVVACDRLAARLERVSRRFPSVAATTRYDELLSDSTVDAVVIATPISTHYPLAAAALLAGKHVMVEKPLAASSDQAQSLIELAERLGLVLMPGHTFLYSPPVILIRSLIASGEIGDIYFISTSRVNLGIHQPDVSVAWDLGRTTSPSFGTGSKRRRRESAHSRVAASSRMCRMWRLSTWSTPRVRSRMSNCRGSLPVNCGGPRSLARGK